MHHLPPRSFPNLESVQYLFALNVFLFSWEDFLVTCPWAFFFPEVQRFVFRYSLKGKKYLGISNQIDYNITVIFLDFFRILIKKEAARKRRKRRTRNTKRIRNTRSTKNTRRKRLWLQWLELLPPPQLLLLPQPRQCRRSPRQLPSPRRYGLCLPGIVCAEEDRLFLRSS
jgi:hypothetical protein